MNPTISLNALYAQAGACTRCDRMARRSAVLGRANGRRSAKLMLVGEAPGRLGADRTGKPFVGDRSGDNLRALLSAAGIDFADVYITNAVLCCPTDGKRNGKPTATELANCRPFLRATVERIAPRIVATLGRVALEQICRAFDIDPPRKTLDQIVAQPIAFESFTLIPLYHPSPRVINSRRNFDAQMQDMKRVARLIRSS